MKVVILAGGYGSRLSEETTIRPKPMVEIGGKPILWHIMKMYSLHGHNEFIICCGYKGQMIKDYFLNYKHHNTNFTVDLTSGNVLSASNHDDDWTVTLVDTGHDSQTGGRLLAIKDFIDTDTFCMTYGDAVSSVDVTELIKFHKQKGQLATVTSVRTPSRFGALELNGDNVKEFTEKPRISDAWINGGFFVLDKGVFSYLEDEMTVLEGHPLTQLALDGELNAFKHEGFWHAMDTMKDKMELEKMIINGDLPWFSSKN